jgi:dipeptidase E
VQAVREAGGLFVGGGNTFRLLHRLYYAKLVEPIRDRVGQGMPYMGSSAGSNVACASIRTTNDMPIVFPPTFDALALVPFQINPHFVDADPRSTHMGETRETRLAEYLEENTVPVVGLREGAWLSVDGRTAAVQGEAGGKLFRRGETPRELPPGTRLDELL